jgi:hypothetical protein
MTAIYVPLLAQNAFNQLQQLTRPFAITLSQQARNAVRSGDVKLFD